MEKSAQLYINMIVADTFKEKNIKLFNLSLI